MAKSVRKKVTPKVSKMLVSPFKIYWTNANYLILGVSILLAVVGYFLLSVKPWNSAASLYLAPLLLVLVYAILFPLSILLKKKEPQEQETK